MGQEIVVEYSKAPPSWAAIRLVLEGHGHAPQMRLIDGELCYPKDEPAPGWTELRVSIDRNMIALRQRPNAIAVVAWGNADESMIRVWRLLAIAVAEAGDGRIQTDRGLVTADEFAKTVAERQ